MRTIPIQNFAGSNPRRASRRRVVSGPYAALSAESIEHLAATPTFIGLSTYLEPTLRGVSSSLSTNSNILKASTPGEHPLPSSKFSIKSSPLHLLGGRDLFDVFPDEVYPQSRVKHTLLHYCQQISLSFRELYSTFFSQSAACPMAERLRRKSDINLPEIVLAPRLTAPPCTVSRDPAGLSGPSSPNAALYRYASSTLVQRASNSSCE